MIQQKIKNIFSNMIKQRNNLSLINDMLYIDNRYSLYSYKIVNNKILLYYNYMIIYNELYNYKVNLEKNVKINFNMAYNVHKKDKYIIVNETYKYKKIIYDHFSNIIYHYLNSTNKIIKILNYMQYSKNFIKQYYYNNKIYSYIYVSLVNNYYKNKNNYDKNKLIFTHFKYKHNNLIQYLLILIN